MTPPFLGALLDAPDRRLFASNDLDETRLLVGSVMKPHQLNVSGRAQRLNARMHHVAFGQVGLSRLRYGADVDIRPGPLDDFYLVQMPLIGRARVDSGSQAVDSTPTLATVLSPAPATRMRWHADNDQIMVRIARPLVDSAAAARHGNSTSPLEFQLGFAWRDCPLWRCLMAYLIDCAAQRIDFADHPLLVGHIEQLVVTTLLSVQPHDRTGAVARHPGVCPRHVRRVRDYLQAHVDEPVTPAELAVVAGASLRSLYAGFRDFCGVSPMQYLRALRLDRARHDLADASRSRHVAAVALRWGFGHLGRFSADYKARLGESPSETLRRSGRADEL